MPTITFDQSHGSEALSDFIDGLEGDLVEKLPKSVWETLAESYPLPEVHTVHCVPGSCHCFLAGRLHRLMVIDGLASDDAVTEAAKSFNIRDPRKQSKGGRRSSRKPIDANVLADILAAIEVSS